MSSISLCRIVATLVLLVSPSTADADPPRTRLTGTPRLQNRDVPELILLSSIAVGRELPPGLPTTTTFRMLPNRFVAACEDRDGIYYQGVGPVRAGLGGVAATGGLYASKTDSELVVAYLGDARRLHVLVMRIDRLPLKDLRKLKTAKPLPP